MTSFLYLNEEDMIKAGVLDSAHCIDVEEELFGLTTAWAATSTTLTASQ